jgi:glucose-6-phosphate-specific signal transduction histidine kinase
MNKAHKFSNHYMIVQERKNTDDASRMIRTLCVLFLVILLTNYFTGTLMWHWLILMAVVIVAFFIVNALFRVTKSESSMIHISKFFGIKKK